MTWYTGDGTYDTLLAIGLAFGGFVFFVSWFLPSPYGRFASKRFGVSVNPKLGWFLMELPATVSFLVFFAWGPRRGELVPLVLLVVWLLHYGNRGFFFPFSMRVARGEKGTFSLVVLGTGWLVTTLHGYLHATFFTRLGPHYGPEWLIDPRFLGGLSLWAISLALNIQSDAIIRDLRTREEIAAGVREYRIPRGGLFRFVTSPSYLTELLAWTGFALFTWSLASVFILVVSAANLVPRAWASHRWYRERFPDYPKERKALVPFVW
ncbi:MAG: 3-oxo-5-alpha-steroid 4-dehydrogenase [Myxococcales bacterium]|nr:3-oxo-5-alpha-steroid 4-dehydrogenase [Myxococcales bacterium]